jgi:hypothetical protein
VLWLYSPSGLADYWRLGTDKHTAKAGATPRLHPGEDRAVRSNSGYQQSVISSADFYSTIRCRSHEPAVLSDTEAVIGAMPGASLSRPLRTGRLGAKLCKPCYARSALGPCHNGRAWAWAVTNGRPRFGGTAGTAGRRPFGSSSWENADGRFRLWSRRSRRGLGIAGYASGHR